MVEPVYPPLPILPQEYAIDFSELDWTLPQQLDRHVTNYHHMNVWRVAPVQVPSVVHHCEIDPSLDLPETDGIYVRVFDIRGFTWRYSVEPYESADEDRIVISFISGPHGWGNPVDYGY